MTDTLATRAVIGVMTPAMNTVTQPELEQLRPDGVTNQMQRFRLGGDNISDDLLPEAEKLVDCRPAAIAIGLTTDAGTDGVAKLAARCDQLSEHLDVPVFNASQATQHALHRIGAKRIAVATPFNAEVNQHVKANVELGGFEVLTIKGTEAPSLEAICQTPFEVTYQLIKRLADSDCEAIAQIGTALPILGLIEQLERETGMPIIACNAAVYWQTLRAIGIKDSIAGFGQLLSDY